MFRCSMDSFWTSCLLQHRPLMGAGYEDPAMHGFSVTVAVESAHCILQGAHRFRDMEWTHYQSAVSKVLPPSW